MTLAETYYNFTLKIRTCMMDRTEKNPKWKINVKCLGIDKNKIIE